MKWITVISIVCVIFEVNTSVGGGGAQIFYGPSPYRQEALQQRQHHTVAIHPSRLQLIKDYLFSMNFHRNGTPVTQQEVENLFLQSILDKYKSSNFYRSFVIAFQHGLIPELILSFGQLCYPNYRDPRNKTLTRHYQKKMTFEAYWKNGTISQFCDFRKGYICAEPNSTSFPECICPEGAIRDPQQGERCAYEENRVCNLIDLDHGNDPLHSGLASNLHQLIFNIDRPIGCWNGTQCRFKAGNLSYARCYKNEDGPFYPPPPSTSSPGGTVTTWTLELGADCVIGLYADPGSCEVNTGKKYGPLPGLVCYNFGLPRFATQPTPKILFNGTGYCAHEYGEYGMTSVATFLNGQLYINPMIFAYVHPRNIPYRGSHLYNYYMGLYEFHRKLFTEGMQVENVGDACSVEKTDNMDAIWEYYVRLNDRTSVNGTGGAFADTATPQDLDDHLEWALNMTKIDPDKKICKVYHNHYRNFPGSSSITLHALFCRPNADGSSDAFGNDGKCEQKSPYASLNSVAYAANLEIFQDTTSQILNEVLREEEHYDESILRAHPDAECMKGLGPASRSLGHHHHASSLEGGYCPSGYLCFEDYGDDLDIYVGSSCSLKNPMGSLTYFCHEDSEAIKYGKCEAQLLDGRIKPEVTSLEASFGLGRGETCRYEVESIVRGWIWDQDGGHGGHSNKYKVLTVLEEEKKLGTSPRFCNQSKLLECKMESGVCDCVDRTLSRYSVVDGINYTSDYCYVVSGSCKGRDIPKLIASLTTAEKEWIKRHYGGIQGDFCGNANNLCLYFDENRQICTMNVEAAGRGAQEAGGAGDLDAVWLVYKFCFIVILLVISVKITGN